MPTVPDESNPRYRLGAYLYEYNTSDIRYLSLANLTGHYLYNHLYNGEIMLDTARLAPCDLDDTTVLTYNTGYTLEGAAVLANLSMAGNDGFQMYSDW